MTEESFNDDELTPPEWLNVQFMTQVLSGYEKDSNLKVTNLSFTPASAKGDRAKVEYTAQRGNFTKSLIIKTMPVEEGVKKDMFKDSPLFTTEIGMYTKVLPEWERILRRAKDPAKLYVQCIYHSLQPQQIIIFDDLVEMGYAVLRDRFLTREEICSAYSKLAKIHAISMKFIHELDLGDMMHKEETRKTLYHLDDFIEETKSILGRFQKSGYFNDL
ncbi:uncharacterized protein LOC116801818 [Drosophila sechellia]|uniref:uncharacterized protein LOC116801818 n=1 Tax=Drosophila sechellia TaxID=7238 RepID=UPI0013DE0076|nr:uncharacterized protein LOC116801818 [Drosophila sechellia]